jgi:hypothetical protein
MRVFLLNMKAFLLSLPFPGRIVKRIFTLESSQDIQDGLGQPRPSLDLSRYIVHVA